MRVNTLVQTNQLRQLVVVVVGIYLTGVDQIERVFSDVNQLFIRRMIEWWGGKDQNVIILVNDIEIRNVSRDYYDKLLNGQKVKSLNGQKKF